MQPLTSLCISFPHPPLQHIPPTTSPLRCTDPWAMVVAHAERKKKKTVPRDHIGLPYWVKLILELLLLELYLHNYHVLFTSSRSCARVNVRQGRDKYKYQKWYRDFASLFHLPLPIISTSPFFEVLNSEKGQKGGYTIVLLYKQIRQVTNIITPPPFVMNETMLKTMGHFQLLIHVRNFFLPFLIQKDIKGCKFFGYLFHTYFSIFQVRKTSK